MLAQAAYPAAERAVPMATSTFHLLFFLTCCATILTFVEPSPYEFLVFPLAIACYAARVTMDIKLMPLVGLTVIYLAGGAASLMPVVANHHPPRWLAISVFLSLTGIIYACIFSQDSVRRFEIMRTAVVFAGVVASILGIIGYFNMFPGAAELFTMDNRALGPTKNPNELGGALVFPLLLVIERSITRKVTLPYLVAGAIIAMGLLLAFSRGSWANFTFATFLMIALFFFATGNSRIHFRSIGFLIFAALGVALLLAVALSIDEIRDMLLQRARLFQSYDVGTSGARFSIQARGIEEIMDHPNGMGPFVFGVTYGLAPHNSFIGSFLNHGWIGGAAYHAILLATIALGLRAAFIRTPWQTMLIVSYAEFIAAVGHALVEDQEHFRPYYLFLGLVWGLSVASLNALRKEAANGRSQEIAPQTVIAQSNDIEPKTGARPIFFLKAPR